MKIVVYASPGRCSGCDATGRKLDILGLPYDLRLASDYPSEVGPLLATLGRHSPIVVAGDQAWSGYRPDLLQKLTPA